MTRAMFLGGGVESIGDLYVPESYVRAWQLGWVWLGKEGDQEMEHSGACDTIELGHFPSGHFLGHSLPPLFPLMDFFLLI